jgi:hypothetical protein
MLGTRYLASKGSLGLSDYHYQDMQNATLRYSFTPQNKPPKHARKSNKKYVQMHDAVMHTHAILKLNKILCTKKYKTSGRNLQRDFVKYGSTLRWWSIWIVLQMIKKISLTPKDIHSFYPLPSCNLRLLLVHDFDLWPITYQYKICIHMHSWVEHYFFL